MNLDVAEDQQLDGLVAKGPTPFPRRVSGNERGERERGDECKEWSSHGGPPA
jgi:hypothetical protein